MEEFACHSEIVSGFAQSSCHYRTEEVEKEKNGLIAFVEVLGWFWSMHLKHIKRALVFTSN